MAESETGQTDLNRVDPHLLMKAVNREMNMTKEQKKNLNSLFETRALVHATMSSSKGDKNNLQLPALAGGNKVASVSPKSL